MADKNEVGKYDCFLITPENAANLVLGTLMGEDERVSQVAYIVSKYIKGVLEDEGHDCITCGKELHTMEDVVCFLVALDRTPSKDRPVGIAVGVCFECERRRLDMPSYEFQKWVGLALTTWVNKNGGEIRLCDAKTMEPIAKAN